MMPHLAPPARAVFPGGARAAGFSLLEVIAVLTLLGVLAAVGMARLGQATLGNLGAQGDARRIALDLLQAQRRAISTGDKHLVRFSPGVGPAASYTLLRSGSGGDQVVEATRIIPREVIVTSSHADAEFMFDGSALGNYQISVAGPDRSWSVSVIPVTGAVRVVETP